MMRIYKKLMWLLYRLNVPMKWVRWARKMEERAEIRKEIHV